MSRDLPLSLPFSVWTDGWTQWLEAAIGVIGPWATVPVQLWLL
ncbi:MAG TPA: hypothetical protein VFS91_08165 [Nitrobacter sp.]|nr:hypothetical protein [Nitrobacter sp.]